jgi:imidazolonepropionase-like amidohydrolase
MRKIFLVTFILIITSSLYSQVAVKGEKIYTMSGSVIDNGVVLTESGKIIAVGSQSEIQIPEGFEVVEGKVVTPGLVDARSVVGLAGIYNQKHDQDQLEISDPIQPELRAIDAFNPREELLGWIRKFGVTTINTGHAPGGLSSGQTMIIKTTGDMNNDILDTLSTVVFSLGSDVSGQFKKPGSRPKGIAMLRSAFQEAKTYMESKEKKGVNLRNQILSKILRGDVPAVITANSAIDILAAIRLSEEFNFKLILDGAAESYLIIDELTNKELPFFLHPMMSRTKNLSYDTPKLFQDNKILYAIQSGYESYVPKSRVILFEAAIAAANGLTFEEALATITINPAKILGIDNKVGSLEVGKDADIAIYDGDPFEYTTHCCGVIINGKIYESECK